MEGIIIINRLNRTQTDARRRTIQIASTEQRLSRSSGVENSHESGREKIKFIFRKKMEKQKI